MGDHLQYSTSGPPRKLACCGSNKRGSVGPLCGPQTLRFPCFEAAADERQARCGASGFNWRTSYLERSIHISCGESGSQVWLLESEQNEAFKFITLNFAMIATNLSNVDSALLAVVCKDRWPETDALEFKWDLPGASDKEKHELLKDVCAFGNADGGDIVFGVEERDGPAEAIAAITSEVFDAAQRRLSQILDSGIEESIGRNFLLRAAYQVSLTTMFPALSRCSTA